MIKPIITTKDAFWQEGSPVEGPADTQLLISDETQQSFRGFGGCFNEIGGAVLQKLSTEKKQEVLSLLFGEEGCGLQWDGCLLVQATMRFRGTAMMKRMEIMN